ncbi:MAG: amidohydrolase family protein [Cyclobacteriaceae bacterium]|nr:amidohydrolase family protein [Cyclobacteriaceae bacterium]
MKKLLFLLTISVLAACQTTPKKSEHAQWIFSNISVIPMDQERILERQDVLVSEGKIVAIGETGNVPYNDDATVIDGTGKFLLPGLAEMHAHVPPVDDIEPMKEVLSLFLANGVTTIRGMLGHPRHLELREKINNGEILGPHFYTTGPSFNGNTVKTAEEGAQKVRDQKAAGYDYLKLHPGLTPETFGAISTTANEVGIPFVGHVSFDVGIQRAIDAGYSSIDHMDGFVEALVPNIEKIGEEGNGLFGIYSSPMADTARIPKIIQGLKEHDIWMVPTQALAERWMSPIEGSVFLNAPEMKYMKQETLDNWGNAKSSLLADKRFDSQKVEDYIELRRKLIRECQEAGVGILLGSDAPQIFNVPGFSVHHELKYLVDAGLTPYEALETGTSNVAKYLGKDDAGVIQAGAVSDLVVLNANPLEDISNTTQIEAVMIGEKYLPKDSLNSMLSKVAKR